MIRPSLELLLEGWETRLRLLRENAQFADGNGDSLSARINNTRAGELQDCISALELALRSRLLTRHHRGSQREHRPRRADCKGGNMKVADLIAKLQTMPQDADVFAVDEYGDMYIPMNCVDYVLNDDYDSGPHVQLSEYGQAEEL